MKKIMYTLLLCVSLNVVAFENEDEGEDNYYGFIAPSKSSSFLMRGFSDQHARKISLEHFVFFQKQSPLLYEFIKKVDIDLEYWKREYYKHSHHSWYGAITDTIFGRFDYECKIIELKKVKQNACQILGMFLECSYFYDENSLDASQHVLRQIEVFFEDRRLANIFQLKDKVEKYYDILESEYQIYKAPHHFNKRWKSYAVGSAALAAVVYVGYRYSAVQKCKQFAGKVDTAMGWYNEGVFCRLPEEIPQGAVDNWNRFLDVDDLEVENDSWFSWKAPLTKLIDFWNSKIVLTEEAVRELREKVSDFYKDSLVPKVHATQGAMLNGAHFALSLVAVFVGYKVVKGLYGVAFNKQKYINSARYNIKKIHQFVLDLGYSRYEASGALFVHTQMLHESLVGLPIEVARAIYEDIDFLQDLSIDEEEKRAIVDRWYNTYLFLKI